MRPSTAPERHPSFPDDQRSIQSEYSDEVEEATYCVLSDAPLVTETKTSAHHARRETARVFNLKEVFAMRDEQRALGLRDEQRALGLKAEGEERDRLAARETKALAEAVQEVGRPQGKKHSRLRSMIFRPSTPRSTPPFASPSSSPSTQRKNSPPSPPSASALPRSPAAPSSRPTTSSSRQTSSTASRSPKPGRPLPIGSDDDLLIARTLFETKPPPIPATPSRLESARKQSLPNLVSSFASSSSLPSTSVPPTPAPSPRKEFSTLKSKSSNWFGRGSSLPTSESNPSLISLSSSLSRTYDHTSSRSGSGDAGQATAAAAAARGRDGRRRPSIPEAALKAIISLGRRGSTRQATGTVSDAELESWRKPRHVDAEMEVLDTGEEDDASTPDWECLPPPTRPSVPKNGALKDENRKEELDDDVLVIESPSASPVASPSATSSAFASIPPRLPASSVFPHPTLSFRFPAPRPTASPSSPTFAHDEEFTASFAAADRFLSASSSPAPNSAPPRLPYAQPFQPFYPSSPSPPASPPRALRPQPSFNRARRSPAVHRSASSASVGGLKFHGSPNGGGGGLAPPPPRPKVSRGPAAAASADGVGVGGEGAGETSERRIISSEAWSQVSLSASSPKKRVALVVAPALVRRSSSSRKRQSELGVLKKDKDGVGKEKEKESVGKMEVGYAGQGGDPLTPPPSPPTTGGNERAGARERGLEVI